MKPSTLILSFLLLFYLFIGCSRDKNSGTSNKENLSFSETEISLNTKTATLYGSLKLPKDSGPFPVVLIIAGSGPTDRNGNNTMGLSTDTYKMISDSLAKQGIALIRYDKRGIGKSYYSGFNESDLTFEDYIMDAKGWIELLRYDNRFKEIFVLGHSEGALIGSIAAEQARINGFISVAGTAHRVDSLILQQLSDQPEYIKIEARAILDSLIQGYPVRTVSQELYSLFRPSIQSYMISWLKYSPCAEISQVSSPLIILHGKTDLQVGFSEAQRLASCNPMAEIALIENMNHILKISGADYQENMATYSNAKLPLSIKFCESLTEFIKRHLDE